MRIKARTEGMRKTPMTYSSYIHSTQTVDRAHLLCKMRISEAEDEILVILRIYLYTH